jgi:hypothetical protein
LDQNENKPFAGMAHKNMWPDWFAYQSFWSFLLCHHRAFHFTNQNIVNKTGHDIGFINKKKSKPIFCKILGFCLLLGAVQILLYAANAYAPSLSACMMAYFTLWTDSLH